MFNKLNESKLGLFKCEIDQSIMKSLNKVNLFCCRGLDGTNNWMVDKFTTMLTNVEIETALNYGVKITLIDYYYLWSKKIESYKMFSFILELMKLKNEQDDLLKNNDSNYNSVLRDCYKSIMNSASGKVSEGLHVKQIKLETFDQFFADKQKFSTLSIINVFNDRIQYNINLDPIDLLETQKPVILSNYLYAYARMYMISLYNVLD